MLRVVALAFLLVITKCAGASELVCHIVLVAFLDVSLGWWLRELQEHLFDFLGREARCLSAVGLVILLVNGHDLLEFSEVHDMVLVRVGSSEDVVDRFGIGGYDFVSFVE